MIKELMKEIKNRNKKKSINITLGVIIGYILTGGIVYSEEIPLKKNGCGHLKRGVERKN